MPWITLIVEIFVKLGPVLEPVLVDLLEGLLHQTAMKLQSEGVEPDMKTLFTKAEELYKDRPVRLWIIKFAAEKVLK